MEFHGRKIMIEEVKTPPRDLVNRLSTNDQKSMYKMPHLINNVRSRLPKALTDKFRTLAVHFLMQLYRRRKTLHFLRTAYPEAWK